MKRCGWCEGDSLYENYHDHEWGVPIYDDKKLFEFLVLESFQAGLSWITILRKREHFRAAFDDFDAIKIADYTEEKKAELLQNKNIIRHQKKIEATINNAKVFLAIQKEFTSFSNYLWAFVNHTPINNNIIDYKKAPSKTLLSNQLCKDLKKRGIKFMGSTTTYAFMQAIGMVNDHEVTCFKHQKLTEVN